MKINVREAKEECYKRRCRGIQRQEKANVEGWTWKSRSGEKQENFVYEILCVSIWTSVYVHIQGKTHQLLKYLLMIRKLCLSLYSVTSGEKREILV